MHCVQETDGARLQEQLLVPDCKKFEKAGNPCKVVINPELQGTDEEKEKKRFGDSAVNNILKTKNDGTSLYDAFVEGILPKKPTYFQDSDIDYSKTKITFLFKGMNKNVDSYSAFLGFDGKAETGLKS